MHTVSNINLVHLQINITRIDIITIIFTAQSWKILKPDWSDGVLYHQHGGSGDNRGLYFCVTFQTLRMRYKHCPKSFLRIDYKVVNVFMGLYIFIKSLPSPSWSSSKPLRKVEQTLRPKRWEHLVRRQSLCRINPKWAFSGSPPLRLNRLPQLHLADNEKARSAPAALRSWPAGRVSQRCRTPLSPQFRYRCEQRMARAHGPLSS